MPARRGREQERRLPDGGCRRVARRLLDRGVRQLGISYRSPDFWLFQDSTDTACGQASASTGPFYCPPDRAIYLDTAFYDDLQSRYGSSGGPLAQMYVVAHEWGHHIQQLQGSFANTDRSGTGASSGSVRVELQADCYAGAWVGDAATTKDADGRTFLRADHAVRDRRRAVRRQRGG